MQGIVRYSLL